MMAPTPEQLALHMARFLDMLDDAFRSFGAPGGLPKRFRDAVTSTPRHRFVHRYRIGGSLRNRSDETPLRDGKADPDAQLAEVYSDAVMNHVDEAGDRLPSTNSQPSYVLWLLHLLELQPGQRVLEIGSGSGWLAAIMARLVGVGGQVTGIEIIPALAAQSQTDLAQCGINNVSVLATDGAQGHAAGAPYDRAMITAAVWDLPVALFAQVAPGGRVLVPVELRGGGCFVAVLQRDATGFVAVRGIPGWFVPFLGPEQRRPPLRLDLETLPFWAEIGGAEPERIPLPLATGPDGLAGSAVGAFRAFLGRTVPGFAIFGSGAQPEQRPWLPAEPFGVVDAAGRSVALWRAGELLGYGGPNALRLVALAYATWTEYGLPGLTGLELQVVPACTVAAAGSVPAWIEDRGGTALIWRPLPDAARWKRFVPAARELAEVVSDHGKSDGHALL